MANPLQKFNKKPSAWRFVKLALKLRAPEPAFGYVLITLAGYANAEGVCYPGYGTLMEDTAYTSKQTITRALKYWRSLGVLTWRKGWGNTHTRVGRTFTSSMKTQCARSTRSRRPSKEISVSLSMKAQ